METNNLNWVKKITIEPRREVIELLLHSCKDESYFGIAIYFKENKNRVDKSIEPAFTLVQKYFFGITESSITSQFRSWISTNVTTKEFTLIENELISFE